jgi:Uma2 family endonuclease
MAATSPVAQHGNEWSLHVDFSAVPLTGEQFYRLSTDNPELRLELTAEGELILMSPTGAKTGHRNSELNYQLVAWAKADGRGLTFDSSTVFSLPNGAKRSPDASWVQRERWDTLSEDEQEKFAPICPDFVAELRSPSDTLTTLQAKMREYLDNGAKLGWLLDPIEKRVYIYRQGEDVECLEEPQSIDGENVLAGLVLDLHEIV